MRPLLFVVLLAGCSSAPPPPVAPAPIAVAPPDAGAPPPAVAPPLAPIEASISAPGSAAVVQERDDDTGIGGIATDWSRDSAWLSPADPFTRQLSDDFHRAWYAPSTTVKAMPVGCIHLKPDGTIALTKLKESSGDAAFDESVQHALDVVKADRNSHPRAVPTHLLAMTTKWVCVRFDPNK